MVLRWVCVVNGGRCVVISVVFDDCRSVTVGANVRGSVFVWRQRRLNFLGVPNGDGFVIKSGGNDWRSRKNACC